MAPSPFLTALKQHMLGLRYSKRTVGSYLYWIRYYIRFNNKHHPADLGAIEVFRFLVHLAAQRDVAVATQKAALNALAWRRRSPPGSVKGLPEACALCRTSLIKKASVMLALSVPALRLQRQPCAFPP